MNPEKLFFISDTHFGHAGIIEFCKRPFVDKEVMTKELIKRWNETVPKDGVVYHLGDVGFMGNGALAAVLAALNGRIILIRGNHDNGNATVRARFEDIRDYAELKMEDGHRIVMCHYPLESWNQMGRGALHLHGHSHGNIPDFGKRMDVGVDANAAEPKSYRPLPYTRLIAYMKNRPLESRDHHGLKED